MTRINEATHYDLVEEAPLVCSACGCEQTIEQTAHDSLMYFVKWISDTQAEVECDRCHEAHWAWPAECAAYAREEADYR